MTFAPNKLYAKSQGISTDLALKPLADLPGLNAPNTLVQQQKLIRRQAEQEHFYASNRTTETKDFLFDAQTQLTANQLFAISREISANFSPVYSSKLTSPATQTRLAGKELLDISQQITREFSGALAMDSPQLTLLSVDPYHLHAYWHVDEQQASTAVNSRVENPLTLRIYSHNTDSENSDSAEPSAWFEVAINHSQNHQSIPLHMPLTDAVYSAAIGKRLPDNHFSVFACSNSTSVPGSPHPGRMDNDGYQTQSTVSITSSQFLSTYTFSQR